MYLIIIIIISNGYVSDNLGWPLTPKPPQFLHFSSPFISLNWVNIETSHLVYTLTVSSPRWWTTNRPGKGRGYVTWHVLNFGGPIHISGMAAARALKLCTKGDYIKSGQRDDKSPLKGQWFAHVIHFWMHNCGLRKNLLMAHCYRWDQQDRRWTTVCLTFDDRRCCHTIRIKLHRFDLSLNLLQRWLHSI